MNRKDKEEAAEIELNRAIKVYTRAEKRWRYIREYDYFADPPPFLTRAYRRKEEALLNYHATHKAVSVWLHKKYGTTQHMEVGKSVTKAELRKMLAEACVSVCANADAKSIRIGQWRKL